MRISAVAAALLVSTTLALAHAPSAPPAEEAWQDYGIGIKKITILREEGGVERRIRIDYKRLVAGDPAHANVFLKPGDTLLLD